MKFHQKKKKKKSETFQPYLEKEHLKELKKLEKNKVKSLPCPYIKDCNFKVLPNVGRLVCLDIEGDKRGIGLAAHLIGNHVWEQCNQYLERVRKEKGILPRELKDYWKKKEEGKWKEEKKEG